MNVLNQKCNKCGDQNTTNAPGWIRSFGIYAGAPEVQSVPPINPAGTTFKPIAITDLCPPCISKLTLLDLVDLVTPAPAVPTSPVVTSPPAAS
jgi:hypothetical protein